MNLLRLVAGFFIALVTSTLIAVVILEAFTAAQERTSLNLLSEKILFIGMFALPIILVGALVLGVPVYLYGKKRGWFATVGRSSVTGGIAGGFFGSAVFLLMSGGTWVGLLEFIAAGAIAGLGAGAIWWAFVGGPKQSQRMR